MKNEFVSNPAEDAQDMEASTQRIEAFSDGVFAIAITLLILEIKIPHLPPGQNGPHLRQSLLALWPSYFAYVFSFVTVGIYWANHHYIFKIYQRTDHVFNLLNVFFLMCISFLPLPTAVLGEYVLNAQERHTAVIFYNLGLFLPAFSWSLVWFYGSRARLIDPRLAPRFVGFLTRQYAASDVFYLIALAVADWNASAGLALSVALTFLYLLPPKKPVYQEEEATAMPENTIR